MLKKGAVPEEDSEPLQKEVRRAEVDQLLRQHNDALVNYIFRWVRSRDDAKDIVQEAYLRIFRLEDPTTISHFRAFLYRTAKNLAINWLKARIVRETFVQEHPLRAFQDVPSPEHIWLAREELEALKRAVEVLPPKCKMALIMFKEDGLTYEEIGAKLEIKAHSAARLVERAMEFLVEAVSQERVPSRKKR
jgi:RNA polymerase sigma factor (sigma-70 family)